MKKWNWVKAGKNPAVVGHYINNYVYSRMGPNILSSLKKVNPVVDGEREFYHHQMFTRGIGFIELKEHLSGVIALAKATDYNWAKFIKLMDKIYPVHGQILELEFPKPKKIKDSKKKLSKFNKSLVKAIENKPKK